MTSRVYFLIIGYALGFTIVLLSYMGYLIKDVPSLREQKASYCEGKNSSVIGEYLKFDDLPDNVLRILKVADPWYKPSVASILSWKMDRMRGLSHQLRAFALSLWIKQYKERELIEFYLNSAYFGEGCYGIDAAAKVYFEKDLSALNDEQVAKILATLKSPSAYSIVQQPASNWKRAEALLRQLERPSDDNLDISHEQWAYEKILEYFLNSRYEKKEPSELVWNENLRTLITSSSADADKYLVNLGFVGFDASAGEDYSCAVDLRMASHREAFKKQLKVALENFAQQNSCEEFNKTKAKGHKILVCKSKEDFTRFVNGWLTVQEQPDAEQEVDCTYLLPN